MMTKNPQKRDQSLICIKLKKHSIFLNSQGKFTSQPRLSVISKGLPTFKKPGLPEDEHNIGLHDGNSSA